MHMKIGKVLILVMSISCLLIGSMYSVVAADEEENIEDSEGDVFVFDYASEDLEDLRTTNEKPNIDIKKVTYAKDNGNKEVTLIIEVYGVIEDRGSLDPEDLSSLNFSRARALFFGTLKKPELYLSSKFFIPRRSLSLPSS